MKYYNGNRIDDWKDKVFKCANLLCESLQNNTKLEDLFFSSVGYCKLGFFDHFLDVMRTNLQGTGVMIR